MWWIIWINILLWTLKTEILLSYLFWTSVAFEIHRPFKCKVCGEVIETTICFECSRLEFTSHANVGLEVHRQYKCRMCGEVFESAFWFVGSRLEFYSEIHPENLKLWGSKSHTIVRCGVKQHFSDTQDLIFLHKAWQFVALKTSWQFVTFKIHRPFKCRMCGKVFESAFLFEGSRLEFYLEIHPEFEALRIYKPHRCELCGKATFQ